MSRLWNKWKDWFFIFMSCVVGSSEENWKHQQIVRVSSAQHSYSQGLLIRLISAGFGLDDRKQERVTADAWCLSRKVWRSEICSIWHSVSQTVLQESDTWKTKEEKNRNDSELKNWAEHVWAWVWLMTWFIITKQAIVPKVKRWISQRYSHRLIL